MRNIACVISLWKRPRLYERYRAHFAAEIRLGV
jgi:hypothetical protein